MPSRPNSGSASVCVKLHHQSQALALANFEFSSTDGFLSLREEVLSELLQSDSLEASSEERVFEALCR